MSENLTPCKIGVFGLGNPDRGDDGVGALVARLLVGRLPACAPIRTRSSDMLSLIEEWIDCDALICIDAAAPLGAPGRVHRLDLATAELLHEMSFTSSHAFGLADAIALARALQRVPKDIIVFGIEGQCFDGGAPMTPEIGAAALAAADLIVGEVGRLVRAERAGPPQS
jgi:hydrogenase maturation protease